MEEQPKKNRIAKFMGNIFGIVVTLCISSIVIAGTIKFIAWML